MKTSAPLQLLDLKAQYLRIKDKIQSRLDRVLEHGQFIMGPEIRELEEKLAAFVGVKHAIGCASGTDALLMALMAYEIKPGDAVFTTDFTFIATAEVIALLGATPVFVDIDPKTKNVDPQDLEKRIEKVIKNGRHKPRGIISVDLFGLPADYDTLHHIAKKYHLFLVEDAAQSFGATYKGKRAGALADVGATSFFPAKPLGCYGDGGAVFVNDDALAEKLKSIRVHGQGADRYHNIQTGLNARLDTIQAAVLLAKLEIFESELKARQKVAEAYAKGLKDVVEIPVVPSGSTCAWAQYSIQCQNRETVRNALSQNGIPTAIYYPVPLHLQKAFENLGGKRGDYPHSESVATSIFSIPMHPYLEPPQIDFVIQKLRKALDE